MFCLTFAPGPSAAFYSLFPTAAALAAPWSLILPPLYGALSRTKCLRALDPSAAFSADLAVDNVGPGVYCLPHHRMTSCYYSSVFFASTIIEG
jgi:hypothetical protein